MVCPTCFHPAVNVILFVFSPNFTIIFPSVREFQEREEDSAGLSWVLIPLVKFPGKALRVLASLFGTTISWCLGQCRLTEGLFLQAFSFQTFAFPL